MPEQASDQELIAAANRGEAGAMEALYYRYRDWVMALAQRFCHRPADAEDVLQEVFKYFFGRFPGFTLSCQLKTYLFPVIRNKCLDLVKRQRRLEPLGDEADEIAAPKVADETAARQHAAEIVAELPAEFREVVILRFVDGLSVPEIAESLHIPSGTVKSRLHRALLSLREKHP